MHVISINRQSTHKDVLAEVRAIMPNGREKLFYKWRGGWTSSEGIDCAKELQWELNKALRLN